MDSEQPLITEGVQLEVIEDLVQDDDLAIIVAHDKLLIVGKSGAYLALVPGHPVEAMIRRALVNSTQSTLHAVYDYIQRRN